MNRQQLSTLEATLPLIDSVIQSCRIKEFSTHTSNSVDSQIKGLTANGLTGFMVDDDSNDFNLIETLVEISEDFVTAGNTAFDAKNKRHEADNWRFTGTEDDENDHSNCDSEAYDLDHEKDELFSTLEEKAQELYNALRVTIEGLNAENGDESATVEQSSSTKSESQSDMKSKPYNEVSADLWTVVMGNDSEMFSDQDALNKRLSELVEERIPFNVEHATIPAIMIQRLKSGSTIS